MVLKATQTQFKSLNGYKNGNNVLIFAKDGNNNWIVGLEVLKDSAFEPIHDQLNELERIEYVPKIEE
jgi:hypothetical protein